MKARLISAVFALAALAAVAVAGAAPLQGW